MTNKNKHNEYEAKRHLQEALIEATFAKLTLDEACKVGQTLALLSIADDLTAIRYSLGNISNFSEYINSNISDISLSIDKLTDISSSKKS